MTAKNFSITTLEQETGYLGSGDSTVRTVNLQEALDTSSLVREVHEDGGIKSTVWDAGRGPTLGLRKGELSLAVDLAGLTANNGGAVTDDDDGEVLMTAIGSASAGTGTTCAAGWTTKTGDVVSAVGLGEAELVLIETAEGNRVAAIEDITASALTLATPLSSAPVLSAKVYAGVTYQPEADVVYGASAKRGTWILEHHMDANKLAYRAVGVHLTPEFTNLGAAEGKVRLNLKASIGDWEHIDSTLDSMVPPNHFIRAGVVQDNGWFVISDGVTSITCIASTFTLGSLLTEIRRAEACRQNTVGQPEIVPSMDKSVEIELWQANGANDPINQLRTWFSAGTMLKCLYQIGDQPTDTLAFYMPGMYISEEPKEVDKNSLVAIKVKAKISIDGNSSVFLRPWYFARF